MSHTSCLRRSWSAARDCETLDWLLAQQDTIEAELARRHLGDGTLVLYDVTSSYLEGRRCPLARFGYSRELTEVKPTPVICRARRLPCASRCRCC